MSDQAAPLDPTVFASTAAIIAHAAGILAMLPLERFEVTATQRARTDEGASARDRYRELAKAARLSGSLADAVERATEAGRMARWETIGAEPPDEDDVEPEEPALATVHSILGGQHQPTWTGDGTA